MLIEKRMSEFVEFTAVPLQLLRSKHRAEAKVADPEKKLGTC